MRRTNFPDALRTLSSVQICAVFLICLAARSASAEAPVVFWASDPVRPGEAVTVVGHGFGDQANVEIARLPDAEPDSPVAEPVWPDGGQNVATMQAARQSFKFVLPADVKPGVFVFRVTTPGGATTQTLNRPQVWWAQGDLGTAASPGGWIRAFGKNLKTESAAKGRSATVRLEGPQTIALTAQADAFAARAAVPADLPPGEYRLALHSGLGGPAAWSKPVSIAVDRPAEWPRTLYNVREFGAEGNGTKDDTAAVTAALDKAAADGGGIVYFPRGRYRLADGLAIPRFTVLRGERRELVALCWTDLPTPPVSLVQGTNSFGLEELTLYARGHHHVISGSLGSEPDAGNVFLRRIRVRADTYRGHLKPEDVDRRFRDSLRLSTGGGDTVRLGGPTIEITDSDFYGSGRSLFLSRVRGGRIAGNQFYNGRWGWYCISGSDGLIFEDNTLTGADLMSTGGGLNCLDGSSYSQNIYYARNCLRLLHGWDREAMTSDAGGEVYFGKLASVDGRTLTLAAEPARTSGNWVGAGVFVLAGRGAGQYRRVVRYEGATVETDRPWTVEPDTESDICITMFQGRYMLVGNEFVDTGAMQFYGTSILPWAYWARSGPGTSSLQALIPQGVPPHLSSGTAGGPAGNRTWPARSPALLFPPVAFPRNRVRNTGESCD